MRVVRKACACLLRVGPKGTEILVFDHPCGDTQLPKGTVEPGEPTHQAVVRELEEETGVEGTVVRSIGEWRRITRAGPDEAGEPEEHIWEIFQLSVTASDPEAPEVWEHRAVGSVEELGLVFRCRWILLEDAASTLDPLFGPVAELLQLSLGGE